MEPVTAFSNEQKLSSVGIIPSGPSPIPTTLRVSLFLGVPVISAVGSSTVWFAQSIAEAQVPLAGLWVIVINTIILIASLLSKEGRVSNPPAGFEGFPGSVSMSLSESAEFLTKLKKCLPENIDTSQIVDGEVTRPGVQLTPPAPLLVYILLSGFVGSTRESPNFSLFLPIISVNGVTGSLPIIIISLIATILERSVVPPTSSGVQPIPEPKEDPKFQFNLQELLNLLRGYNRYFK